MGQIRNDSTTAERFKRDTLRGARGKLPSARYPGVTPAALSEAGAD